ncbi:hypothetical protein N9K98_08520 [Luminiphilus sp.]|nr:hypothetical protein [Luminiphilus sp.]
MAGDQRGDNASPFDTENLSGMGITRFKKIQARTVEHEFNGDGHEILSGNKVTGWSVNFPIGATCQPSKLCADTCYGLKGPITWSSSLNKQARNLAFCRADPIFFADSLAAECRKKLKRDDNFYVRWNGVGDLFPEAIIALKALNEQLPSLPIWCVTRIPRYARQLYGLKNLWVHFSLDKSSMDRYKDMKGDYDSASNLFFSYQCEPDEKLEYLPEAVRVLFFDNYKIKEVNKAWTKSAVLCPLNKRSDITGACFDCRRCFNGSARLDPES